MPSESSNLFELINEYCTAEQIKGLLRECQKNLGRKQVQVGSSKEQALQNLRSALDGNKIQPHILYNMLQRAEENGDQHILYYLPKTKALAADLSRGLVVGNSLFGEGWEDAAGFPRFTLLPDKYVWVDFRYVGKKWIGKLYGHDVGRKLLDRKMEGDIEIIRYKTEKHRHVCVVCWNGHSLEIRISRSKNTDSRKEIVNRVDVVWGMLHDVVDRTQMPLWDLTSAKREMASSHTEWLRKNAKKDIQEQDHSLGFSLSSQQYVSPDGESFTYSPEDDADHPSDLAMTFFKSFEDCDCEKLAVHWEPQSGLFDAPFSTFCGSLSPNEINIRSSVTPEAIDYVTSRFRQFDERAAGS